MSPAAAQSPQDVTPAEFPFQKSVLVQGLGNPFQVRVGPDGWLWVTERTAGRLSRVNPENGSVQSAYEFQLPEITSGAQTGVMGFAFHPDFGSTRRSSSISLIGTTRAPIGRDPTRRTPITACSTRSCGLIMTRPAADCRTRPTC
ncbi:PQQ-dependent sugar dehydrogenase [Paracoccus luteus]|uniref:PQQ-dependent sugar dehydrogenase n=1 Tax=Paracoccus luteus TaxID=2508543 RepID=UPI00319DB0DF